MSVYSGDNSTFFRAAIESTSGQILQGNVESRLYLAVDGEVGEALEAEINRQLPNIYKLVRIEQNAGLANALNRLIDSLEDEELVFRMDADDISFPERYQKQIAYLDASPAIDIVGTSLLEMIEGVEGMREISFSTGPKDALKKLGWRVPVGHPSVCFRRHVLTEVRGYPLVTGNEDIAMWFACARKGFQFDNVKEPLLYFRVSQGFWKRRGWKKALSEWRVYMKGSYGLNGVSPAMLFATARLILRVLPAWVSKIAYKSGLRRT